MVLTMDLVVVSNSDLRDLICEAVQHAIPRSESRTDWLSNKAAQDYLELSRPTLQRLRSSGKLPFSKVGGKIYYRRADVEALLERHLRRLSST